MHHFRHLAFPVLSALVVIGASAHGDPPATAPAHRGPVTVEVRGVRVAGEGADPDNQTLRPFDMFPGTGVALLVTRPGGGLLAWDSRASHFVKAEDDKGTNLFTPIDDMQRPYSTGRSFAMNRDGSQAMLNVEFPGVPAKGARELVIQGTLRFRAATEQKTVEATVPVRLGGKISAGPYSFIITEITKPRGFGEDARWMEAAITLESHQDLSDVIAIRFFDPAGNEIDSSEAGGFGSRPMYGRVGPMPRMVSTRSYNLGQKPDTVKVKITYWADPQQIKVPVDVKVNLGL